MVRPARRDARICAAAGLDDRVPALAGRAAGPAVLRSGGGTRRAGGARRLLRLSRAFSDRVRARNAGFTARARYPERRARAGALDVTPPPCTSATGTDPPARAGKTPSLATLAATPER